MKSKKLVPIIMCLMFLFTLFTGVNSQAKASAGKTTLRFATWDSDESLALQQKIVDKFNAKNPDIKVTLEAYGDDFDTKIAAGIGAGDAPDVMYMWNYPLYGDALEPLDSYIAKEGTAYKSNFYEALWNYNSKNGKTLGMPVGYTTHVVYYNKAIFDKAKIKYPTANWTWNDLMNTAKKLTNKKQKVYGFAFSGKPDPYDFEMHLWNNGAQYVGKDLELDGNLNSKKSIDVFTMFQKMEKDGIAITTEGSGSTEMKSGKVAMFINGSWSIDSLKKSKINFGVTKIPSYTSGKKSASIISSSGVAIAKTSKNKAAAWKFVKFWTSDEANKMRIGYELPVLKSVVKSQKIQADKIYSVFYTMLDQSKGFIPTSFKNVEWSDISEKLSLAFEQIFNPSTYKDVKKALDEAAN